MNRMVVKKPKKLIVYQFVYRIVILNPIVYTLNYNEHFWSQI